MSESPARLARLVACVSCDLSDLDTATAARTLSAVDLQAIAWLLLDDSDLGHDAACSLCRLDFNLQSALRLLDRIRPAVSLRIVLGVRDGPAMLSIRILEIAPNLIDGGRSHIGIRVFGHAIILARVVFGASGVRVDRQPCDGWACDTAAAQAFTCT